MTWFRHFAYNVFLQGVDHITTYEEVSADKIAERF
jgi:hypothetical protein